MNHTIFLNDKNFIEIHTSGSISLDDISHLGQEAVRISTTLEDEGLPVKILIDCTHITKIDSLAVCLAKTLAKNLEFDQIAVFGTDPSISEQVSLVTKDAKIDHKFKLFRSASEAEDWLSR